MNLIAIGHKAVCLLFVATLLLVGPGKAQEKSDRVSDLIQQLRSPDSTVRLSAAVALGKRGPEAVPALLMALKDPNDDVRSSAALSLGEIGPGAKDAVSALVAVLKDKDAGVYFSAAEALTRIGSEAVPALVAALKDANDNVRSLAIDTLGGIGPAAVPTLLTALKDSENDVCSSAAYALGKIGPAAKDAVPALIAALKGRNDTCSSSVIFALGQIGSEAKAAVFALIAALKSPNDDVRILAAEALGRIGPEAVPALLIALKDPNDDVRSSAAKALGEVDLHLMARFKTQAVPALIAALSDQTEDVRGFATIALSKISPETKSVVPALIDALKFQNEDVRESAAIALGEIRPEADKVVPVLIAALDDKDGGVRGSAARALGKIGPEAVPALIAALKDSDEERRDKTAEALSIIATDLFDTRRTDLLPQLKLAYEKLKGDPNSNLKDKVATIKRTIDYFESLWWVEERARAVKIISTNPYISLAVAAYLLLQITWLLFFWLRPLSLLKVISSLSRTGEKFKIPIADIPIPLKTALVFPSFHYRTRLLDAWVRHHLALSRDNFAKKQTVVQRKIYVAMPALIDGQMRESLSAPSFQPILEKKKVTVLIVGEGGAGKTSLACQMAIWAMADGPEQRLCKTHRMLPVLIEANLTPPSDGKDALIDTISGGLRELIGEPEPICDELLRHLLQKRRVLVIADSLSELDEATRKSIRPAQRDFPIAALVVTSRIDEDLGGAAKTLLRPLRLKSDRLSTFMDRYLEQLGKRDLFNDEEYFDACRRLSQFVSDREITVLIAKMYAEQMVAANETDAAARDLPSNLPDLMLGYVKRLNDQVKADKQDIHKVVSIATDVAWECLKRTCRPTTAKRDDVMKAIGSEADAETLLKYLEERLQLTQTSGPISDLVRFSLDPLAEYLAAFYLVERCGKSEELWNEFFGQAKGQPGAPETIKGFLLAVRDCCVEKGDEYSMPRDQG